VAFDSGLEATVGWYRDNRSWWEPLIGRSPVVESSWSSAPPPARQS
jgi:dTDP-glucose 4,6-dehydratase